MDDADISEPKQGLVVTAAAKKVTAAEEARRARTSAEHCLECGNHIPEKRRRAQAGCEYCVRCQSALEKFGGFWP